MYSVQNGLPSRSLSVAARNVSMDFTASLFASTDVDIVLHLDDSCKGILHSMQKDMLYLPLYNHFSLFSLCIWVCPSGVECDVKL